MLLNNDLKRKNEIALQLINLWCDVFGDDEAYAQLILPFLNDFDCFAEFNEGEIVSALYLLPCVLNSDGKEYSGRYLYAAATAPDYRGKGIMGKLINEALEYTCRNFDYISLVPASESLYSYYSKFGFRTTMYRYKSVFKDYIPSERKADIVSVDNFNCFENIRKTICSQSYKNSALNYAYNCYSFYENKLYCVNNTLLFCHNKEENEVIEFLSSQADVKSDIADMVSFTGVPVTVYSPYKLQNDDVKEKCGMTVMFNGEIKKIDNIYMNLTLG